MPLLNEKKELYLRFCESTYVPIFSQSWWMDILCGKDNWDVWLYDNGEQILAAMPYYMEQRGEYRYITKPLLTQNNGIIFKRDDTRKAVTTAELQEKIINAACEYIKSLKLDVYEQQFHRSFQNWQPFFWNRYTNIVRYTYVIENTTNLDNVFAEFSANYRKNVRKGQRLTHVVTDITPDVFFDEHEKIFLKQGLQSPINREQWGELYSACCAHQAGQIICAKDDNDNIHSVMFVIWDDEAMYPLLGGYMPEYSNSQSYPALTYYSICMAHEKGLAYDFEGSMIQRIAKSFRQFGGRPMPYYRIRKVFNPEIVRREAEDYIRALQSEGQET